jgi:hypothetical protein
MVTDRRASAVVGDFCDGVGLAKRLRMPSSVASLTLLLTLFFTAPLSGQAPEAPENVPTAPERAPVAVETSHSRAESTHASEVTRVDSGFENDSHTTAIVERPELRLEIPTPQMRRDRRARRLELTGWTIVGASAVTGLAVGLAVGMHDCGDDAFLCFNGPVFGLFTGLLAAAPGIALGTIVGTLGTVRRRRSQHAGTWSLAWSGSSVHLGLVF